MEDTHQTCRYERAYEIQFRNLESDLDELKARMLRIETTLARGIYLLVTNLACVAVALAQQLMR